MTAAPKATAFDLKVELDREANGRRIADIPALPGVMVYGRTRKQREADYNGAHFPFLLSDNRLATRSVPVFVNVAARANLRNDDIEALHPKRIRSPPTLADL